MSEWITHRRPTFEDAKTGYRHYVWVTGENGIVLQMAYEIVGDRPWMPITPPEPYVKQKIWKIMTPLDQPYVRGPYAVYFYIGGLMADKISTREAAERIAAIYEEVMP